ncbi:MAG: acetyl-CoA carboxylase biotin carboxyl carrier protein [Methylacidiphilales bacterium]|nr:acetyl-CoA carboxylase biotin carboxyl carrier protein [Candidatus Methylacidiphilales bacterium]MDW8348782.1 acetyl-CoA carboxylase biotin carboxyl carrier protein [Verrucomicrobiae bacterium]
MEIKDIRLVIELMDKHGLGEFELEKKDFKIRLKKSTSSELPILSFPPSLPSGSPQPSPQPIANLAPIPVTGTTLSAPPTQTSTPPPPATPSPSAPSNAQYKEILSPMVGTFYRSPSPEAPPYVEVGQEVTEDTVVCIIEAMKVMNEIKAEIRGTITEILAENGKPVDYAKPLFRVRVS